MTLRFPYLPTQLQGRDGANKRNIVQILNMDEDKNWFKAELSGREGFVPAPYVKLKPNP